MATLTGKITDVTHKPPESLSSITVKAPSVRVGGGTDLIVPSPATVDFDRDTGDVTISGLTGGLSWLYLEGEGWSDSVPLAVAEGMISLVEAIANASSAPGIIDYLKLLADFKIRFDDIAQDAVDAAADGIKWDRGLVGAEVASIDELELGSWGVASAAVANNLGLPGTLGTLEIFQIGGSRTALYITSTAPPSAFFNARSGGVWAGWVKIASQSDVNGKTDKTYVDAADTALGKRITDEKWSRGGVSGSTTSLDDLPDGAHSVMSASVRNALGLPGIAIGTLHLASKVSTRTALWVGTDRKLWVNTRSGGAWGAWREMASVDQIPTASDPQPTDVPDYTFRHDLQTNEAKMLVGQRKVTGTGVALVFDHGTNVFNEALLPLLRARGLTATIALNSQMYDPTKPRYEHDDRTDWDIITSWWANDGIEIANHGRTHQSQPDDEAKIYDMAGGLEELRAAMPTVPIHSFVTPSSLPLINGINDFDTPFGRELWANHAVIASATNPKAWPLVGEIRQGVGRMWFDSPAGITATKNGILGTPSGRGIIASAHPEVWGSGSNSTIADIEAFLDWLVVERDAGRIEVMTLRELAFATAA